MKKIIMYNADTNPSKITGGKRRFREILLGLLEAGYSVDLYITDNYSIESSDLLERHTIKTTNSKVFPNGLLNLINNYSKLRKIRNKKYDAIIIFEIPYGLQLLFLGIRRNVVLFLRQDFREYRKIYVNSTRMPIVFKSAYLFMLKFIERVVIYNSNKIVVQSNYEKSILLKRYGLKSKLKEQNIEVLPNNVNPSWIKNRNRKQIPTRIKKIVFIGNLDDKRKGLDILLNAGVELFINGYNFSLEVFGSGKLLKHYKSMYDHYAFIRFNGYTLSPIEKICESDLLVVPSLADSFPNSVLEAIYTETIVFGSRVGGIPEILFYEELLFDPNSQSLQKKIECIINQPELIPELQKLILKRKKELTFNWVKKVLNIISN